MKIEIDLNDILGDEYGAETLQESIRRQVIDNLTKTITAGVGKQIDSEVAKVISEEIRSAVKAQMPTIVTDLLNAEYTPVDRYGDRDGKPTTFRKELLKSICDEMKYKKAQYNSEKTAFTKAVDDVVGENLKAFKSEFNALVNKEFTAEVMAHASAKLREKLGIK